MSHAYTRDWWEELLQVQEFAHFRQFANELTRSEVDFIEYVLAVRNGATILDLACGNGRHALELARRGYAVEGVDAAPSVITYAQQQAATAGITAHFVVGDMRDLNVMNQFDAVLVMNSSIGFFDDNTNQRVLAEAARAIIPNGCLLLQCINPYQIEAYLQHFRMGWYQLGKGYILRQAHFEPRSATLQIDYRYIEPERGLDIVHPGDSIRLYGFPELTARLEAVGLFPEQVFGDAVLPLIPFDEQSRWQVVVARKRS